MNRFEVRCDLLNPGHFFACCGLLELAARLGERAEGWFEGARFLVEADRDLETLLRALVSAPAEEILVLEGRIEVAPLIAPLRLRLREDPEVTMVLDAWMSIRVEKGRTVAAANPPWNFWAGQQTSLRIWSSLKKALTEQLQCDPLLVSPHLFEQRVPLSGRFGFDPGAAWNALDAGFSPNDQKVDVASSPAVELLSAVGLQRFRPLLSDKRDTFHYCAWAIPLPPLVAAPAASGALALPGLRRYLGRVTSRGSYAALGYSTLIE